MSEVRLADALDPAIAGGDLNTNLVDPITTITTTTGRRGKDVNIDVQRLPGNCIACRFDEERVESEVVVGACCPYNGGRFEFGCFSFKIGVIFAIGVVL
jgi:hypothetical protein